MPRTVHHGQVLEKRAPEGRQVVPVLREARYSQSLERGLAILASFTPEHPILGIKEISAELGMSPSTIHRYVITLVALGYLKHGPSRKYRLGLRVTDLGMSALSSTGLREHARPYLAELCERNGYTASLSVLDGLEILYLDRVRSLRRWQGQSDLDLRTGSRLPAYCTSMGKLLLAYLPKEEQRTAIGEMKLTRRAPNSITSKKALRAELERVCTRGFAVNDRELAPDLHSIAVPIRSESREVVASVNLAAHTSMIALGELVDALGPHLIAAADRISACLGYRRDDEIAAIGRRH